MTDTTTPAPTDEDLVLEARKIGGLFDDLAVNYQFDDIVRLARAVLAKWGAPAPASGAAEAGLRADIHESLKYEGPDGWEADWGDVIDAVEKHHGITAAQKETP